MLQCAGSSGNGAGGVQLDWCGSGAVVLNVSGSPVLLVLSPHRDNFTLILDSSPCYLYPESDGLRIIGQAAHEFLQKVNLRWISFHDNGD